MISSTPRAQKTPTPRCDKETRSARDTFCRTANVCLLSIDKAARRRLIRGGWKLKVRRASRKLRETDETRDTRFRTARISNAKASSIRAASPGVSLFSFSNLHSPSSYLVSGWLRQSTRKRRAGRWTQTSAPLSLLEKSKRKAKVLRTKYTRTYFGRPAVISPV